MTDFFSREPVLKPADCRALSTIFALLAFCIGAAALAGWIFDIDALKQIHPALVNMKANTSICLMLAAISVLLLREESTAGSRRRVAHVFAVIIALIGMVTLSEHLFGWDAGIDQFLFRESAAEAGKSFPGRMGVAASLNLTFLGLALLFLDVKPFGKTWVAHWLVMGVAGVTLLVFLYYFFGVEQFEPIAMYATIALHTVVAFVCLCLAILFARANRGIMGVLLGDRVGSIMARRMLPFALFVPVFLGWLRVMGEKRGYYGTGFGSAVLVMTLVLMLVGLIWWSASTLNRADAQRRKVEESVRSVALFPEQSPAPVLRVGRDGTLLYANPAAMDMFKEWNLRAGQAASVRLREVADEALKNGKIRAQEQRVGTRDYVMTGVPIPAAGYVNLYWLDVTESKRAEEALRQNEAVLRTVTAEARVGLVMVNKERRYLFINQTYADLLGLPSADIVGKRVADVLGPLYEQVSPRLDRAFAGERVSYELRLPVHPKTRDERFYDVVYQVRTDNPDDPYVVAVITDITERKHRQTILERAVDERTTKLRETVQELEGFSYSIAHDLRAPLRAMQGFSDILVAEYGPKLGEEGQRFLGRIASAAGRMDSLIQDVLNYSRVVRADLPLESVKIEQLLRDIVDTYPMLSTDKAEVVLKGEFPVVLGNEAMLTQVFSNLLGNAVKFVGAGVRPHVRVWAQERDTSLDRKSESRASFQFVRIFIQDNGIGIAADQHEKIFGMFQRASKSYEGTGIGLAIVRKAVERMGGKVGLDSRPGQGSTFWVELPRG
jgi:PAS domain S-box-containing protein